MLVAMQNYWLCRSSYLRVFWRQLQSVSVGWVPWLWWCPDVICKAAGWGWRQQRSLF